MSDNIVLSIEALVFASDHSIGVDEIVEVLKEAGNDEIDSHAVENALIAIEKKYNDANFALTLSRLNGGFQFLTRKAYHPVINLLQAHRSKKRLSQAAVETLAIVAYRQPVTKLDIEQIRGVNCDYTVQKLLEKDLIRISGKAEGPGRPLLYSTSMSFADYLGIDSSASLPRQKDLSVPGIEIGQNSE